MAVFPGTRGWGYPRLACRPLWATGMSRDSWHQAWQFCVLRGETRPKHTAAAIGDLKRAARGCDSHCERPHHTLIGASEQSGIIPTVINRPHKHVTPQIKQPRGRDCSVPKGVR